MGFWRGAGLSAGMAGVAAGNATGLHWVRAGLLCCAVVTAQAQLQVGGRGAQCLGFRYVSRLAKFVGKRLGVSSCRAGVGRPRFQRSCLACGRNELHRVKQKNE